MKKKKTLNDPYFLVLEDIMHGSLRPGEIVTETALAEKYGISRTPIREALYRLEIEGLINTTKRTKRIYSLTAEDIKEIFELKELIEGDVALSAAGKISDTQKEEFEKIILEMNRLREVTPKDETEAKAFLDEWLLADSKFHQLLFRIAGNKRSQQLIARLNIQWHRLKIGLAAMEGRIGYAIPEHETIARAVIEKDPEKARKEMVDHLENLKKYILKLMEIFG
jgi:DNA-binding GntR family transcriptional regulator